MSNSNTPNESQPCICARSSSNCDCPVCRPEAPARAPETATQCYAREQAEILAFRFARITEAERLRTFLKDCCCPCCNARYRLRVISYDRACESPADIHCASTDRRDDNKDPRRAERIADLEAFARAGRYAENARRAPSEETVFPALDYHETDTDAR